MTMRDVSVIIVAGGSGRRMGSGIPKQFLTLDGASARPCAIPNETVPGGEECGKKGADREMTGPTGGTGGTEGRERQNASERGAAAYGAARGESASRPYGATILEVTLLRFSAALPGCETVVVLPADEIPRWKEICRRRGLNGTHRICAGGETRFQSVRNGIEALGPCEYIAVHDGVRPLATVELILRCVEAARQYGAAVPAVKPADSFRRVDGDGVSRAVDRDSLRAVQTPQVFRAEILRRAYETEYCAAFTDDASVAEAWGAPITLCEGDRENIKITTPEDLTVARAILDEQIRRNAESINPSPHAESASKRNR